MKRKVFHFASDRTRYRAGACVIGCIDARFELATRKFLKRRGLAPVDHIQVAGGPKELAFLREQVRTSVRLHQPERILLLAHADCGAWGGTEAFAGDGEREEAHHASQLAATAAALRGEFGLPVECFYLDFEGVWEVGQQTVFASSRD